MRIALSNDKVSYLILGNLLTDIVIIESDEFRCIRSFSNCHSIAIDGASERCQRFKETYFYICSEIFRVVYSKAADTPEVGM